MPIVIKDKIWSQTDHQVYITLPLNGVHPTKIKDIFIAEKFVKVSYGSYYFEAFLAHSIDTGNSKCKILENHIKFVLHKKSANVDWEQLEFADIQVRSNVDKVDLKKDLLRENELVLAAEIESRRKIKAEFKRQLIDMELKSDQKRREEIEAIQKQVKDQEIQEVQKLVKTEVVSGDQRIIPSRVSEKKVETLEQVPTVRQFGTIEVNFSERRFITPQRESQEIAEREWILKQNEIKKDIGFNDDDLRPEERNPKWLLEKGNEFYKKGNYRAAISAYSTGINIAKEPAILLLNRATAHYGLENYNRCVMDTSKAYDLFVPAAPVNLQNRIRCLSLRGAALAKLGFLKQGHTELLAAKELDPRNTQLLQDIEMIETELRKSG